MPAITAIYRNHPKTNEEGVWINLTTIDGLKGSSNTQLQSFVISGITKEKLEQEISSELTKLFKDLINIKVTIKQVVPLEIENIEVSEGLSKYYSV